MAHRLLKFYSAFGGLDTSPNLLKQNPESVRRGSKNFRWNYTDQLQKREGFQHKTADQSAAEIGLIEYKFKDINTGESKTEILGVASDGHLRKLRKHRLKLTRLNTSLVAYYSLFYDSQATTHKIVFYSASSSILGSVNISLIDTLDTLKTFISTLSLNVTPDIVDESGIPVIGSTTLAYLLDVVDKSEFAAIGTEDIKYNEAWYWELVSTPDGQPAFVNAIAYKDDPEYEGISYVNAYNCCYITDGGFPYKYDGKTVYRAGMPKTYEAYDGLTKTYSGHIVGPSGVLSFNYVSVAVTISNASPAILTVANTADYYVGMPIKFHTGGTLPNPLVVGAIYYVSEIVSGTTFKISDSIGGANINTTTAGSGSHTLDYFGGAWTTGDHFFRFQLVFKDKFGAITYGKAQPLVSQVIPDGIGFNQATISAAPNSQPIVFKIPRIVNEAHFPIYACKLSENIQISGVGPHTISVSSGHNIQAGQVLRIEEIGGTYNVSSKVTYLTVNSVTPTTVVVQGYVGMFQRNLLTGQVLNSCDVPDDVVGKDDSDFIPYGPSWQLYATKAGGSASNPGTFYKATQFPVPATSGQEYSRTISILDANLSEAFDSELEGGEELPRACRYLSKWQNQLIQAGRPVDTSIASDTYPTVYNKSLYTSLLGNTVAIYFFFIYSESHLCDFQSIYWADVANPEGFSQSGANEESFENLFNDKITGMAPNKEALFVFKNRTTAYLTGTLATGDIVKEFLEADVGCATHHSIQEVRGSLIFMDENFGFWAVVAGRLPEFIGFPVQDFFKENYKEPRSSFLNFKRAKAANFRARDLYICYIPAGKNFVDPTSDSVAFLFDYSADRQKTRSCWYAWQDFNAVGGILSSANDELIISSKQTSGNRLWKQKATGGIYDFSDHTSPIEFNYLMAFLTLDYPIIDKSWHRIIINSIAGGFDLLVKQYGNFMNDLIGDYQISFPSSNKTTVKQDVKAVIPKLSGISFGFYNNTIHQDVKIEGWEIEYSADFDTGEPKR